MDKTDDERQRFSLDLPFWLNGTLSEAEHRWMEDYLARHPECKPEVRFARSLHEQTRAILPPGDMDLRADAFARMLRQPDPPAPPKRRLTK